jgi:hypothetical protein
VTGTKSRQTAELPLASKLPRYRLRGDVPQSDLTNDVMDQKRTSGSLPFASSASRGSYMSGTMPPNRFFPPMWSDLIEAATLE